MLAECVCRHVAWYTRGHLCGCACMGFHASSCMYTPYKMGCSCTVPHMQRWRCQASHSARTHLAALAPMQRIASLLVTAPQGAPAASSAWLLPPRLPCLLSPRFATEDEARSSACVLLLPLLLCSLAQPTGLAPATPMARQLSQRRRPWEYGKPHGTAASQPASVWGLRGAYAATALKGRGTKPRWVVSVRACVCVCMGRLTPGPWPDASRHQSDRICGRGGGPGCSALGTVALPGPHGGRCMDDMHDWRAAVCA